MKVEIVAGCELDAAVAKAIGLQGELVGSPPWAFVVDAKVHRDHFGLPDTRLSNSTYRNGVVGDSWNPSTDANAAFEAADKFGLWKCRLNVGPPENARGLLCRGGKWYVVNFTNDATPYCVLSGGGAFDAPGRDDGYDQPELAICAAILLLDKYRVKK